MATTIITIGYRSYALRRPGDAASVLKALADAVALESRWMGDHEVYWPDERHQEVSMRVVQDKNILPADPRKAEASSPANMRQLRQLPQPIE